MLYTTVQDAYSSVPLSFLFCSPPSNTQAGKMGTSMYTGDGRLWKEPTPFHNCLAPVPLARYRDRESTLEYSTSI